MSNELRRNSIGFWGVVFYAVSVIFPAGAFAITGVAAMTYAGETAPLAFLIGGITLFLAIIPYTYFLQGYPMQEAIISSLKPQPRKSIFQKASVFGTHSG